MGTNEALTECEYRIRFAANLYGSRWREEVDFLKACKEALEKQIKDVWQEGVPDDKRDVLVNVSGQFENSIDFDHDVLIANFSETEGWEFVDYDTPGNIIVHQWHEIPDGRRLVEDENS